MLEKERLEQMEKELQQKQEQERLELEEVKPMSQSLDSFFDD